MKGTNWMRNNWLLLLGIVVLLATLSGYFLLGIIIVLAVALYYLLRWLLNELAERNLFVTFRTEGQIKAIMKGKRCMRYIMAVENFLIDPDDFDIYKGKVKEKKEEDSLVEMINALKKGAKEKRQVDTTFKDKKLNEDETGLQEEFRDRLLEANKITAFEKIFGVALVGIPPLYKVFEYRFRWIKYTRPEIGEGHESEDIKYRMIPRQERVDSLYARYPAYGLQIDDAEAGAGTLGMRRETEKEAEEGKGKPTLEKVQVLLDLVFETVTTNPQKTLFRSTGLSSAGDWVVAVAAEIRDHMRVFTANRTYEEILTFVQTKKAPEGGATEKPAVRDALMEEVINPINDKIERDYGQRVERIRVVNVDLKDAEIKKAVAAFFKEKQLADASQQTKRKRLTLADAAQREAAAPLLGRAQGYKEIVKAGGRDMEVAASIGNVKVLTLGGGGLGNIVSLPEKLLGEGKPPASPPTPSPEGAEPPEETP